jgi:DNA (cytosine-5)-methyltransferase 1
MAQMTGVSLFAGVGGFDLAMEKHGVKVVATCEIDKNASKILAQHFPNAKLFSDVQEVTGEQLIRAGFEPRNGIITGGFPCQDLSVAGRRAGLAGERSGLFWEIARLIQETETEWFILENVPGLLSSNKGKDMGIVIGTLADLGYSVAWRVLDAQYFGVPQRRRRVFIVGRRNPDGTSVGKVLFEPESLRGNSSQSGTQGEDTSTSSKRSTSKSSERSRDRIARMRGFGDYEIDEKASALKARDWKDATDLVYPEGVVGTITTAFGAKNYSNHQELMEGSVVVFDK